MTGQENILLVQTLLCDDVRREITGKDIIIGTYGDLILLETFPANLQFCLWNRVRYFGKVDSIVINLQVVGPSGTISFPPFPFSIAAHREGELGNIVISPIRVPVEYPGDLAFQWQLPGRDWETLASLTVSEAI
ncbi:MAG: hypothetical protein HQL37_01675 [Alphaproteobacteria bacterium]|nr:hypothetical protein [Alphaproteobacteria bacterium]